MDIKMHAIKKTPNTPDLGDGKNVNPVHVKFLPKKGNAAKDTCCSIDEEKRQLRAQRPVWKENFTDFCRSGTLHGVRHLVDSYSRLRKIIWLVIIIIILIIFLYAISAQFVRYHAYSITSTVNDQYRTEMKFPSVTICNKNPCQMSAAYKKGWQGLLSTNTTFTGVLESVELLDYQKTCAQKAENMIVKCSINGINCNADKFKSVMTERGQCYTLAGGEEVYVMRKAGPESGLRLLLNAETAEYSPSASGQEGFQITLHDGAEVPADSMSLSIAPGTSTRIQVQVTETKSLSAPYGQCAEWKALKSPGPYSQSKCFHECQRDRIRQRCFCDAIFTIPSTEDKFPVCGMKIYQTCVQALVANMTVHECDCPPMCNRIDYSPTVSFSKLSNQFLESMVKQKAAVSDTNIERDFVENKLLQYHHANRDTEQKRIDDVITSYNSSVSSTYPFLTSSVSEVAEVLKNFSEKDNGRYQFLTLTSNLLQEYDDKYHATVFSALQSASFLINKYLDAMTAFAFVSDQVNYTAGAMDENRVSQILRLKLDEFRIHYEHTIQSLDRVDKFYSDRKLKDYDKNHQKARQDFRTGIITLYANISAISMHQGANVDKFYRVADIFNQDILPMGQRAYLWYPNELRNLTGRVSDLSSKLTETMKIVANGPREWDNFADKTLYRAGTPSYIYEAEHHWENIKSDYLKDPGNITRREFIVSRSNGDLTNLTHFILDLTNDLDKIEEATMVSLDLIEELYTIIIETQIIPASVLGKYPIWNISSQYLALRIRWGSLAERNRPVFKSVFKDTIQRVREKLLSRKIQRHYYPNGEFDKLHSAVRHMDVDIKTTLTKLKDHMTYFLNSVSIENVFREELYKDNFCQVDIFFKELCVRTITESVGFCLSDAFLYIAIAFAVYFGGSIFTLLEVLDVVVRSVYTKYCHRESST